MIAIGKTAAGVLMVAFAMFGMPVFHARAAEDVDIAKKVQAARTAADHEEIAKHFEARAAEAAENAALHRRMGESYKGVVGTSAGKGAGVSAMPQHCEALAKTFESEADHFKAMAKTHRDLAESAQ